MSIDPYFARTYNEGSYNCAHFVAEVWEGITGQDIHETLGGFLLPPGKRFVRGSIHRRFVKLEKPKSPCIVLMHKVKGSAHAGLLLHNRVLHIQRSGVSFQPLEVAIMGFKTHRFYDVKNSRPS